MRVKDGTRGFDVRLSAAAVKTKAKTEKHQQDAGGLWRDDDDAVADEIIRVPRQAGG